MLDTYAYSLADPDYYAPLHCVEDPGRRYLPWLKPPGWTHRGEDIWTVWDAPGVHSPDQGWKVHVSARFDRADAVLDQVARVCFAQRVPFKHIAAELYFLYLHHKHGPREQAGKFCVAYPPDEASARWLLERLADVFIAEEGPYVLSDRRYRDSTTVHYRFGAFSSRSRRRPDGTVEWLVRDAYGRDMVDARRPAFVLPRGISDPFADRAVAARPDNIVLGGYEVVRAVQPSNAGGTYEGRQVSTGRKVFIKEARAHNGLYWDGSTAAQRLRREHKALRALHQQAPGVCPAPIDYFREWEHEFLVTEFVEGVTLSRWAELHSPLLRADRTVEDFAAYYADCAGILADLDQTLERIHGLGCRYGDVNPMNVIVTPGGTARLVDFEAASGRKEPPVPMGAVGYTAPDELADAGPFVRDEYGLASLALSLLMPLQAVAERSPANLRLLRRDLERYAPVPEWLWQRATRFFLPAAGAGSAGAGPAADTPAADLTELAAEVRRALLAMADPDHPHRVFPTTPRGYRTNTVCVAHGTAGVLHALLATGGRVPAALVERFRRDALAQRDELPPGLHVGSAGVSWVLAELGLLDEAATLLAAADRHPVALLSTTLGEGLAGVGMAHLNLHARTGAPGFLDGAVAAGDAILGTAELMPTLGGAGTGIGLLHGMAGLSLFLLALAGATGRDEYRAAGRRLLAAELERAAPMPDGSVSFPDGPAGRQATPYLYAGTAGVVLAATRYAKAEPDGPIAAALPGMLADISRTCTSQSGLCHGLAGLAFALAEHADWSGGRRHRADAVRAAAGLAKYGVPGPDGIRYLGGGGLRFSADLASGGAGVLLALHRVVSGPTASFFTLDRPQRPTRHPQPVPAGTDDSERARR